MTDPAVDSCGGIWRRAADGGGHDGARELKRRKTGPAVQILSGQPCVCVGS